MKKIILEVSDSNEALVLTILANLKSGLIEGIQSDSSKKERKSQYQPRSGTVVEEGSKPQGKYASASAYRDKLNQSRAKKNR